MSGPRHPARSVAGQLLPSGVILARLAGCQCQPQLSLWQYHTACTGKPPRRATHPHQMAQPYHLDRS